MTIDSRSTATPLPLVALVLATALDQLDAFVAQQILKTFDVAEPTGTMPIHVGDRRVYTAQRDPKGGFQRVFSEVKGDTYQCAEAGLEAPLFDGDVNVYGDRARAEQHKAQGIVRMLLRAREAAAASLLFSTSTFDAAHRIDVSAGDEWDDATPGNAVDHLVNAVGNVEDRGFARESLSLIIPSKTLRKFSRNASVISQVRSIPAFANLGANSTPAVIPNSVIAALLGIKEVITARGIKDTSNRAKTSVNAAIWDEDKCLVAYLGQGNGDEQALGHTLVCSKGLDKSALSAASDVQADMTLAFNVEMYREEQTTADIIRVREQLAQKVTNVDAGCLVTNVLA